jgi:serine/threonine protein kinase
MSEDTEENEIDSPIFFDSAIEKLRKRFPVDDVNFFDPKCDFNIDISAIKLCEQIAKGSYGIVYNGVMRREKYAIKVEDLRTGVEEQVNILSELSIFQSFPHECLVKFYGTGYLSKSHSEAKVCLISDLFFSSLESGHDHHGIV